MARRKTEEQAEEAKEQMMMRVNKEAETTKRRVGVEHVNDDNDDDFNGDEFCKG